MRWPIIALTFVCAAATGRAQDMPLSQILIDGEDWKPVPGMMWPMNRVKVTAPGVEQPTCQVRSPDGGTLFVGSAVGKYIWAFRIGKDGSLDAGQQYGSLRVPRDQKDMPVAALCVDSDGRIYAATPTGVQIFDPTGRLCGVLLNPTGDPVMKMNLTDGMLYVATKSGSFGRKVKSHAVR
jgi:sugar lactone lactonase YvrE